MIGRALSPRWVYAALAAYVLGFALFVPRVLTVVDEDRYVSQAVAFAGGGTTIPGSGIIHPPVAEPMISNYPPGTSLLQTPFVWMFGWRGAVLLSVLSLIAVTLVTARWLRDVGRSPAFALLIPSFLPAALFGRIAMSDVPSAALVAVTCWLLWRAERAGWLTSFAAGLCAALILLFREPVAVLLAPLLLGALLRRKGVAWAVLVGGIAGAAVKLGLSKLFFDSPMYVRDPGITFAFSSLQHTLPLFAFILLVLFPAGAMLPFFYHGERRVELVASVAAYVGLFLFYDYDAIRSQGPIKGTLLAARYMIPALPLLVWMAADVCPRVVARMSESARRASMGLTTLGAAGAVALSFAVHPMGRAQEGDALTIVRGIQEHTSAESPVITNSGATLKYLSPSYGPRRLILRQAVPPHTVPSLLEHHRGLSVVLLDRVDSEMFRGDAADNDLFVARLADHCQLSPRHQRDFGWARLRVLAVDHCGR